jgi:hypothetical protein
VRILVNRLRAGDEAAFVVLAERYQAAMLSTALIYVRSRAVAEEVVQGRPRQGQRPGRFYARRRRPATAKIMKEG